MSESKFAYIESLFKLVPGLAMFLFNIHSEKVPLAGDDDDIKLYTLLWFIGKSKQRGVSNPGSVIPNEGICDFSAEVKCFRMCLIKSFQHDDYKLSEYHQCISINYF